MTAPAKPSPEITAFVCGTTGCPEGGEHDGKAWLPIYGPNGQVCGESVACSKCGSAAFDRDLMVLP